MIFLSLDNKPVMVWKPNVTINIVKIEPFMQTQIYFTQTYFIQQEFNITLRTSLVSFIKAYSKYQIGDTIDRECGYCGDLGYFYHEDSQGLDIGTIDCEDCNGTGKQSFSLLSIDIKQAKELAKDLTIQQQLILTDNDKIYLDDYLLIGEIE